MSPREVRREDIDPRPVQYTDCEEMARALEGLLADLAVEEKQAMPGPMLGAYPKAPVVPPPTRNLEEEIRQLRQAIEDSGCRHDHHRR